MSEFKCEVIKVGSITKHPNADTLGLTHAWGYPVVIRLGEINEGDLAVYIPIDSVVPTTDARFSFLGKHSRIKAKKLRGIFSMGLLLKADPWATEGAAVAKQWGITKWEEPDEAVSHNGNLKTGGNGEHVPFFSVNYDVSHFRRYGNSILVGERVVVTEKIHGCNSRFVYYENRLYTGSHNTWKKTENACLWWKLAKDLDLETKLSQFPNKIFYGEAFGWIQDLRYDHKQGEVSLRFFDIFDLNTGKWLDFDEMVSIVTHLGLQTVPVLYEGPWEASLKSYSEGMSTLGDNIREGVVIRPVKERFDPYCGRPVLKLVSEEYLLRHEKNNKVTEKH